MSSLSLPILPLTQRAGLAVWVCALLACQGCATGAMLARDLPAEWQAVAVTNAQTVDLTKLASATIPQDLISRHDVVSVDITVGMRKEDNAGWKLRVDDTGHVKIPHIGSVPVMGLSMLEAEDAIRAAAINREVYLDPQVTVAMHRPKVNQITVIGAVNLPGIKELRPGNSDLLQAITIAGGLAQEAGTIVEIRHPGFQPGTDPHRRSPSIANGTSEGVISAAGEAVEATPTSAKSLKVDLASIGKEGVGIPLLMDGTVISVEKRDPQPLTVVGLVNKAGQYEFQVGQNLTVLDAIAMGGGINSPVANKIYVIRKLPGVAEPKLIHVSYAKAKRDIRDNILLQPGDVVSVEQTPATVFIDVLKTATFGITGRAF